MKRVTFCKPRLLLKWSRFSLKWVFLKLSFLFVLQWFAVIVGFCRDWVICKMLSYFYDTKSQEDGLWFQLFYIRVLKRSNSQSHGYSGAYTGFCPRGLKSFSFQKWWGPETLSKPYKFYWSRSGLNPPPRFCTCRVSHMRFNGRRRFRIFFNFWFLPTMNLFFSVRIIKYTFQLISIQKIKWI